MRHFGHGLEVTEFLKEEKVETLGMCLFQEGLSSNPHYHETHLGENFNTSPSLHASLSCRNKPMFAIQGFSEEDGMQKFYIPGSSCIVFIKPS